MYYVTICTFQKEHVFGDIRDGEMILNDFGRIVEQEWKRTPVLRPNISLDEHVVMPNHIHGILHIVRTGGMPPALNQTPPVPVHAEPKHITVSQTIGAIVRGFKSAATIGINDIRGTPGTPVWHRNYYEHVIRNEDDLIRIREYIRNNPMNWASDEHRA